MKRIDFHTHIETTIPIEKSAEYFKDMCERFGYSGINILAFVGHNRRLGENFKNVNDEALRLKELMGEGSYAFGCLLGESDFAKQAERLMSSGFDGIKLLRGGKPNYYRDFPHIYDDEIFDDFFALAEERQYPIIMHNNDPAYSWDITKAPLRAIQNGWIYGDDVPSHKRYYEAVDNVLAKYPNLNLAIAHMGFYTEDLSHAFILMEKYPNLKLDITPALNIYKEMSQNRDESKRFFETYNDRLIFGTDAINELTGEARAYNDTKNKTTAYFFGDGEPALIEGRYIAPIDLDEASLENIYYKNAMRFIGKEK